MSPAMRRRSPARGRSRSLSDSPGRNLPSPPRRSSHHRRSPDKHRSSDRTRSPVGTTTSLSTRSLRKEKLPIRARPPERQHSRSPRKDKVPDHSRTHLHRHSRSPVKSKVQDISNSPVRACSRSPVRNDTSRSPSPRSKRLKLAHSNKEADKLMDKNNGRTNSRVHDKGARKEATLDKEISNEKRLLPEKSDDRSSRSVRNNHSKSPHERNRRRNHSDRSPLRSSRTWPQDEVTSSSGGGRLGNAEDDDSVAKMKATEEALEAKQKEKPSFELSGKLAEETNRVRGVTLLFTEPEEARKPDKRWRLYVFKAGEVLNEPLYIHRQSCYLFGRERRVADIPTDHPSCSKQHAVIQYRLIEKEQPDGMMKKQVRPYLMDLGSTNGTFINDNRIERQRYYELFEKDTIKFGNSSREYVILHENSAQ